MFFYCLFFILAVMGFHTSANDSWKQKFLPSFPPSFPSPHLSSSPTETPSSQAPTTAPARCTTCAPTRRWLATRTAAWTPASRLWRSPTQAASSSPATTTSTATSGTHWRERKSVSGEMEGKKVFNKELKTLLTLAKRHSDNQHQLETGNYVHFLSNNS